MRRELKPQQKRPEDDREVAKEGEGEAGNERVSEICPSLAVGNGSRCSEPCSPTLLSFCLSRLGPRLLGSSSSSHSLARPPLSGQRIVPLLLFPSERVMRDEGASGDESERQ